MKNILLIAILLVHQAAWAQTTYHVATTGNDGNPGTASSPLRNIQTALNLAVANDMIKIAEGTYNEGLITQSKVNLSGGYASDFLDANRDIFNKRTILSAVSAKMLRDTHGSTIDGFVFDGNNTAEVGLDITSSSTVRHNIVMRVKTSPGQGINISGDASVINNTFHNNITGAIIFGGTSATAIFKNNIITSNSFGLNNSSADGIHRYNCVFGNSFNYTGNFNSSGIGDISLDPKHVDVAANDFRIAESSPCVNAGDPAEPVGDEPTPNGSRIDMGAYGGTVHSPFRVAEPVSQPTTLTFTNVTSSSFTINYLTASGSPSGYIAVRRTGASPTSDPVDGTTYSAGNTLGDGTVVFVGSGLTFNQSSLSANTQYFFKIYSFNGSGNSINYLQTDPLQGNVFTLASEPTAQPTSLVFNNITTTSLTASFTAASGNPGGYLAVRRQGGSPSGVPVDGTAYTNGNALGDGTVVYSGSATTFDDTALLAGTPYHYDIFSFNGSGSSINYRTTSPLEGSQTTMAPEPTNQPTNISFSSVTSSSFAISFTPASGGPAGYIALRKAGSAPTEIPVDGTSYSVGNTIGSSTVVYVGNSSSFNDSGLTASTLYHIAIFSYNGNGALINYLTITPLTGSQATTSPADATPPSISSHTPATSVAAGSALTVTAQFTDSESGIAKARIHFGPLSALNFDGAISADMTNTSGNTYSYSIAANQNTDLGIYYFFYLEDGAGNYFWSSPTLVTIQHTGDGLTIPFDGYGKNQNKYRIISVPLSLTINTVNSVFGDDFGDYGDKSQWRMFRYQSGATQELNGSSSIVPGNGYWLIVDDGRTGTTIDSGPGTTINAYYDNPYSINLSAGWNQIGNPYPYNISWQDILDNNTTTAVSKLRVYKGTWQDGTILEKFSGGFVNSNANISLAIPSYKNPAAQSGRVASSKRNPIDHEEWEVLFNLTAGNVHYNLGGIGMHPKASEGYDVYDDFTLPRFGYYLELNHHKKANNIFYARDIVPSAENYEWRFDVATNEDAPVEMKWDNDFFGDNDRKLVLWDEALQKPVDMRRFNSYKIPAPAASFKVWYGNETFIRQKTEVDKLILQNLYPNPADDQLHLSFSLPGSTPQPVNATLYDALGNRVAVLLHEEMDSGYHEIMWTASEISAGLYIIRIQCGARQISRKVLIK